MNENLLIIKLPDFNLNCSAQKILILKIQLLQLYQKLLSLYFARMPCTEFSKCQRIKNLKENQHSIILAAWLKHQQLRNATYGNRNQLILLTQILMLMIQDIFVYVIVMQMILQLQLLLHSEENKQMVGLKNNQRNLVQVISYFKLLKHQVVQHHIIIQNQRQIRQIRKKYRKIQHCMLIKIFILFKDIWTIWICQNRKNKLVLRQFADEDETKNEIININDDEDDEDQIADKIVQVVQESLKEVSQDEQRLIEAYRGSSKQEKERMVNFAEMIVKKRILNLIRFQRIRNMEVYFK
ncbi:Hypothetical_protein [Hexamita inflata]|uniref:Hypothetical_protein n=1 Tax=Hexamita inflata TaxID=28002 RepID=A0ABP1GJC3_9EUKA